LLLILKASLLASGDQKKMTPQFAGGCPITCIPFPRGEGEKVNEELRPSLTPLFMGFN
jgi:hypothetical protein